MITPVCQRCLRPLSPDEQEFYGLRCESCAQQWSDRIEAWRHGAPDAALDRVYDQLETVH